MNDGSLFARADQLSAVRDMAALHFVRSLQMKHAHYASFGNTLAHQKAAWRSHPQLLRRIYQEKTGLYTTGSQAIEYFLDKLFGETAGQAADGALLRERVVDIYEKARNLIDCGCRQCRHLTRPANTRGSGHQAGHVFGRGCCRPRARRGSCRRVVSG